MASQPMTTMPTISKTMILQFVLMSFLHHMIPYKLRKIRRAALMKQYTLKTVPNQPP